MIFLPASLLSGTVTKVTLDIDTSPATGQARVGYITVTGENFPSGVITPGNVTVSLQPATVGRGPAGTTRAAQVKLVSGSTDRLSFQIPASIAVSAPTVYQVTFAGSTLSGNPFQSANSARLTVNPPSQITSLAPNSGNAGESLSVVITGLYTSFVQGTTLAGFGPNVSVGGAAPGQPGPVTVTSAASATAQITIGSQAPAGAVTVTVTTGPRIASRAAGFTILAAPQILISLSPDSANAALSLPVVITGRNTSFVQGTTVVSFGPYVSVGGAAQGHAGPVTVTSPASATAHISIDPAAVTGPVTVTVSTGNQQASLAGGFHIATAVAVVNINTSATRPLPPGFSGFCDEYLLHGAEFTDQKYISAVQSLHPGFIRFPGGLGSMAFDWQTGHLNQTWIDTLAPNLTTKALSGLTLAQELTQAKGGACFTTTTGGPCFSNFQGLVSAVGALTMVDFNGWTDTHTNSAGNMVVAAQAAGLTVTDWELANEPYLYRGIFPTAQSYAVAEHPYQIDIASADPDAPVGLFYQGAFSLAVGNYQEWDDSMAVYTPHYWNPVSMHIYPIDNPDLTTSQEEQTLNGFLAHGANEYIASYVQPLLGNAPLFLSEFNSDASGTLPFESYLYNGIFLAEYIARMSTAPNVQAVAVEPLYLGNSFNQGILRALDDHESYLLVELADDPNFSTNTAVNPATQFSFYASANALALEVLNQAVNSSNFTWSTTVSGGPMVPILGYDGNPIPALFAQGYQGTGGARYLVITNKSAASVPLGLEVNGTLGPASVTVSYVSNASDIAQNTATAPANVQIVNTIWTNPMTIGPYSVTRFEW